MSGWRNLVLYDGECGLCDRSVQWLLRHDARGVLSYAPLQGELARQFVDGKSEYDTIVLVERDEAGRVQLSQRSRAAFRILDKLGGGWRVVSWLRLLPAFVTDWGYRLVARNRLRWFGKVDACRIPDLAVRGRFLA